MGLLVRRGQVDPLVGVALCRLACAELFVVFGQPAECAHHESSKALASLGNPFFEHRAVVEVETFQEIAPPEIDRPFQRCDRARGPLDPVQALPEHREVEPVVAGEVEPQACRG